MKKNFSFISKEGFEMYYITNFAWIVFESPNFIIGIIIGIWESIVDSTSVTAHRTVIAVFDEDHR